MYGWYGPGPGGGSWVVMMVAMVVLWAIFVIGIVALLRHYGPQRGHMMNHPFNNSAIDILKERFARGELTEEEYSRRLTLLKERP